MHNTILEEPTYAVVDDKCVMKMDIDANLSTAPPVYEEVSISDTKRRESILKMEENCAYAMQQPGAAMLHVQ